MNFTLCLTSSEITYRGDDGLRYPDVNIAISKVHKKAGKHSQKDNVKLPNHDWRKVAVSSLVVPGHVEGSNLTGRKQSEESRKKPDCVRTLLIDNYDSYTYNIYQELSTINGVPPVVIRNDEWTWEEVCHYLYEEGAFDNIVISPGPGSPTCPADIGICLRLFRECWDIPVLGVCLGHQALGYAHGGRIVHAPEPVHGRLSGIEHDGSRLFLNIPSDGKSGFKVVRYHSLVIEPESLPEELQPIAWTSSSDIRSFVENQKFDTSLNSFENSTEHEAVNSISEKPKNGRCVPSSYCHMSQKRNVLMGIMHSTRPHYGLQFHPESVATCYGRQIFKNFRKITEDYWQRFKSSSISLQNFNYSTAHMQMPGASPLFRELSRTTHKVNSSGDQLYKGKPATRASLLNATKICPGVFDLVDLSYPRTGAKILKLKWRKIDRLACIVGGARRIFFELFGQKRADNTFWLDSSSTDKARARFSFMGSKGGTLWKQLTFRLSDQSDITSACGGHLLIEDVHGSNESTFIEKGFLEFLNKELSSFFYDEKDYEGLPFDFHGGYVGYIGYNLKVECGMASNRHKSNTPDACFFFADNLVVIDHHLDDVYILSIQEEGKASTSWLDDTEQKLLSLKASGNRELKGQASQTSTSCAQKLGFLPDKTKEQYVKDVQSCLNYIKDGESYELCLTTQNRQRVGEVDALGIYLHLRERNPAPYAAFLNFSKENLCLCCSSPERFLRLDGNGVLEAKPIKGTIPRGSTPEEDERLRLRLRYSEKDQAENLMIVDLLRNDLGRVCEPGSVHVPNLMDVESYATVHTMVSTIRGQKRSDISPVECVRAAFPGGSMTGAPKLRSMEILDSLENCSRGVYSGSVGFFSYNGTFDLNIVIRTVVIHKGEASIGAGGAIVALSNPEDEYEEMILKTRAPARAVMEFFGDHQ